MSLNSGVTANGDEMSRAQIVQAQAARADPDARMNPILLKPHSDTDRKSSSSAALGTYGRPRIFREKEGTLVRRHRLL